MAVTCVSRIRFDVMMYLYMYFYRCARPRCLLLSRTITNKQGAIVVM